MKNKLELYWEDIDDIFNESKQNLGYHNFTVSSKKEFDPILNDCLKAAKHAISNIYTNTEEAVKALAIIQERIEKVMIGFRIADESFKHIIYSMSPGTECDSTRPYSFKESDWKLINR